MTTKAAIIFAAPQLQIDFAFALEEIRKTYLQDALRHAVRRLKIADVDAELTKFVPAD